MNSLIGFINVILPLSSLWSAKLTSWGEDIPLPRASWLKRDVAILCPLVPRMIFLKPFYTANDSIRCFFKYHNMSSLKLAVEGKQLRIS